MITTSVFTHEILAKADNYQSYREMIERLLQEGKVTGDKQTQTYLDYTKLNLHRMSRLDKRTVLPEFLVETIRSIKTPMIWVAITEGWCGDAAQNLPVIQRMADVSDNIQMKYILRDENPAIMDEYLTNGARAIPIVVGLHADTLEELFVWGPRPFPAMELMIELKNNPDVPASERGERIHTWYAKDRSVTLIKEFTDIAVSLKS